MNRYLMLICLPILIFSCKNKPISLAGSEKVAVEDFINFFLPLKLPYQITGDSLRKKDADATAIGLSVFRQFVPDSVLAHHFGKSAKPRIYALGKTIVEKQATFLWVKAVSSSRKVAYLLCFDKNGRFVAAKPLVFFPLDPGTGSTAVMDTKYTLSITRQRKTPAGDVLYKKEAFVFSNAGFILILTESNEPNQKNLLVINPIEALPHRHKYSGDYVQDKHNFISVRDGKDATHVLVFIHFEKDNGECRGELKGNAKFISNTIAQYRANGDPCAVEFIFGTERVSMKELEGCGNHRDIKCFFEGSYRKQKEAGAKPVKKKKK